MFTNKEEKLLKHVKEDYAINADQFDKRRQTPWKEFDHYIKHIKHNDKVADIGCGNGRFYDYLKNKRKVEYTGIDITKELITLAKKRYKAKFKVANAFDTKEKSDFFDTTLLIATLHHIPSKKLRKKTIQEMNRITKKDGIFIISVWNLYRKKYIKYFIKAFIKSLMNIFKTSHKDLIIPWGENKTDRYFYALSPTELKQLLISENFKILNSYYNKNTVYICQKIK